MRVLVVDDDLDIRETVCSILAEEGYEVSSAGDGAAALAILQAGPRPDVILLDLMMPVMNGWQFREAQRQDPRLSAIPVVVMSADASVRDKMASFGGTWLAKPVDIDTLLGAIEAQRTSS